MSILRLPFRRETLVPMLALLFATLACVGLVYLRISRTGQIKYTFLLWNLFLAWIPLVLAFLAAHTEQRKWHRGWTILCGTAWLLFFPNSSYIFTDLVHLTSGFHKQYWVDLTLILTCAFTGLIVGFMSLFLMQSLVERLGGKLLSWLFIGAVAALSGVGVYVGRFLRFNSWDVLTRPMHLIQGIERWLSNPASHPSSYFPLLFAAFLLLSYLMLYALTHLQHLSPELSGKAVRKS